jgi:two-component system sensor histidine kinase HydH
MVTTVALAVVLVGLGLAGYLGARQTSRSVARARGLDLALSVRRALVLSDGRHQEALQEAVEDMAEQGLRYAAVVIPEGVLAEAGEPSGPPLSPLRLARPRGEDQWITPVGDDRIRVVVPLLAGPAKRRSRLDGLWGLKGSRKRGPGARPILVLEYEPVAAAAITSRALAMLLISVAAGTVLLGAGVVFWRMSRRTEAMSEQLARDRQLKALGEMSAVLGHELRNPLAALKGHAQLLVEQLGVDHPGRRGAETVVREAVRMEELTSQILEFARTGAIDPRPVSPPDLARAAIEESGLAGIDLAVEPDLPPWPLDRARMERVLVNLLRNASQATGGDGPVELSVSRRDEGLVFEVRDHGPGIRDDDVQWIFEPFHTRKVRGTGLGLAVAKRIVEAHDGRIHVRNHPEGGAVFTVWLPQRPIPHW